MNDEFQRLVDERGSGLRKQTREELLGLYDAPIEEVQIAGQAGTIALIVEEDPEGSLRVIVQGFLATKRLPRLGIKHVALDGFRMNADATISELRDEEFYEFD